MNRTGVSFFMSAVFHIALLSAFAGMTLNEKPAVNNPDIRITLVSKERQGSREPMNSSGLAAAQSVEPPKPEMPTKKLPNPPAEPPKTTTPKPSAKPSEGKPTRTANRAEPKTQTTQNVQPSLITAPQAGATVDKPNFSASNNPSGAEKTVSESPVTAPKILDVGALKITKKVNPDYPMISRKRKDHGTVLLLIEITSGRVTKVEIEKSSGHAPLDESAVRAMREWRFDASGYGESVIARIPFAFSLR
jgi:protein TonB